MVASVPVDTKRTRSAAGTRARTASASSVSAAVGAPKDRPRPAARRTASTTSGWAWPSRAGPHEPTRSTYSRPSTSLTRAPRAPAMKTGAPPTEPKARTGESTPPGMTARAASNRPALVTGAADAGAAGSVPGAAGEGAVGRAGTGLVMVPPVNGRAGLPGRRPTAVEEAGGRRPVRLYVAIGAIGAGPAPAPTTALNWCRFPWH